MNNDCGKFLQELRKEKGLTQIQLSKILHITDKAISRWENSSELCTDVNILKELCTLYDVSIQELMCGHRINEKEELKRQKKKELKYKIIIGILIFLLSFFFIYFIFNYKAIKMYKVKIEDSKFEIINGYYLKTNEKNTLFMSVEELVEKYKILSVEIYDNEDLIYLGKPKNIKINNDINLNHNCYINITYIEEDEIKELKQSLIFTKEYENKQLIKKINKKKYIVKKINDISNLLIKLGFTKSESNKYIKNITYNSLEIIETLNIGTGKYNAIIHDENLNGYTTYYLANNIITLQITDKNYNEISEIYHEIDTNKTYCKYGRCNYEEIVSLVIKDIMTIKNSI